MQEFKERLKELRDERGLSMKELGYKIGVSDAAVCKWENGVSEPKITYILRLAKLFDCSTDFLLGVTDDYHSAGYFKGLANRKGETDLPQNRPYVVEDAVLDSELFVVDVVDEKKL